jgi:glycosyltransferase involved in cell wall biosynthesis
MNISVVIPTYWTSSAPEIKNEAPDAVYDHPTPLESRSTLPRVLDSLKGSDLPLESATVTIVIAVTHEILEGKAKERTRAVLEGYKDDLNVKQFSASTLKELIREEEGLSDILSVYGYSNVRNIGLAIAQILKSDTLVFLDDDVVIRDPDYFAKTQEHVGQKMGDEILGGIAGYYLNANGGYYLTVDPKAWWTLGWPKEKKMNEAFEVIESEQRLTETTFAFGGNMVLHWSMFENVPFDPYITRGEDMDLLVNAQMFGFKFMLDTKLRVLHLPGKGKKLWSEMRQDLHRFVYMREKMLCQRTIKNIRRVPVRSLEPYPGHFLHVGTSFKFAVSSWVGGLHSIRRRDWESFREFSRNILEIPDALDFAAEHCLDYFRFQKEWARHIPRIRENRRLGAILGNSA